MTPDPPGSTTDFVIDALAGLLQLNPAERALLLYGTLARYQRDLRGLLVEFKVSNAQEAYAAIAAVAAISASSGSCPKWRTDSGSPTAVRAGPRDFSTCMLPPFNRR